MPDLAREYDVTTKIIYIKATSNLNKICFGMWDKRNAGRRLCDVRNKKIYQSPKGFGYILLVNINNYSLALTCLLIKFCVLNF